MSLRIHPSAPFILLLPFLFSGCLILPIPHIRLHAYGVKGQIIDQATQRPIPNATITDGEPPAASTHSDSTGHFNLPPQYGWHAAYCFGVIPQSLCPDLDMIGQQRIIEISAPGHSTQSVEINTHSDSKTKTQDNYLLPPPIPLAPVPATNDPAHH